MDFATLRSSIQKTEPRELEAIERVYVYGDYLLLNSRNQGLHVIDNTDPSNPVPEFFVEIPGNTEVSIRDGVVYADSYIDLVALTLDADGELVELSRQTDIFPYDEYQNVPDHVFFGFVDREQGVVVGYE